MKLNLRLAAAVVSAGLAIPAQPPSRLGIFDIYEQNRAKGVPNFVTEDFLMASYWLILSDAITQYEETKAAPALNTLLAALMADPKLDPANQQFLAIFQALLGGKSQAGSEIADAELKRVNDAAGPAQSDLFRQQIDYSQFKVRGKYTRTEAMRRYFVASKLASTVLFPVMESAATGITAADADELTRRALDLARATEASEAATKAYTELTSGLEFLFGPADDLTIEHYRKQAGKSPSAARKDLLNLDLRPSVISIIVDTLRLEKGISVHDVATGWRLLPQRFTADSAAFQELVFDKVKGYQGAGDPFTSGSVNGSKVKVFPTALELMAIQGSRLAESSLQSSGDTNYQGYAAARARASKLMSRATGLNALHMAFLKKGFADAGRDHLNSALAFWTQDRYSSILYAKQSYTAVGKGMALAAERAGAWIDPRPGSFQGLAELADVVGKQTGSATMSAFAKEATRCAAIAAGAARTKVLSKEDENYLNGLDLVLFELTGRKDTPIVVDVHTDGNSGTVLEEAIGFAVPASQGKARGGRASHYEFKHPMQDRLTDDAWIQMIQDGKLPAVNAIAAKEKSKIGSVFRRGKQK